MGNDYYDPREPPPAFPPRPGQRRRQSTFSIAMEALGGGLVIAIVLVMLKRMLGF
jgi:hypothetical protein